MNQIIRTIFNAAKPPKDNKHLEALEATLFKMNHL